MDDEFVLDVLAGELGVSDLTDVAVAMRGGADWVSRADALVGEQRRWHVDVHDVYVFQDDIVYGEIEVAR